MPARSIALVVLGALMLAGSGRAPLETPDGAAAGPPVRTVVHKRSPRVSLVVAEPWYFEYGTLYVDNNLVQRFPGYGPGMSIWFKEPTRKAWDSPSGRKVPFPRDLVKFVIRNPYVRVLGLKPVRLGGIAARQIDVVARRGDPKGREANLCGEFAVRDEPCVPITADSDDEGFTSLSLEPGEPVRLIDLRTPSGRLIIVVRGHERVRQLSGAERILQTLRVG